MNVKKTLFLLVLLLSIFLSGCDSEASVDSTVSDPTHQITEPKKEVEPFIGFAETEVKSADQLRQLKPEELRNYTSQYSDYNTYTYYQHLNDTEKLVYHAYEYAMDEGLPYFWVDDRLLQGLERSTFQILEFLSLDSAVVEQNIARVEDSNTVPHTSETYTTIYVEDFTKKRLKNKNQAILDAKIVLSQLNGHEAYSHRELAEYFYDYLGGCVGYIADVESDEYLYSGLRNGDTNCDGFANAFALMCILTDIPCIEINSDTPPGEIGHTWNMVYLENKWVHVDATGSGDDVWSLCDNRSNGEWVYFGFPDALLKERILYADLLPACPEGLTSVEEISSVRVQDFGIKVKNAFLENDNKYAIILLDQGELDDQTASELATELEFDLYYIFYETAEGKMVYYLFNDD